MQPDEMYDDDEIRQRLQKILKGTFSGPPTPLKDIPTCLGKKRAKKKAQPRKRARQRKNRAA